MAATQAGPVTLRFGVALPKTPDGGMGFRLEGNTGDSATDIVVEIGPDGRVRAQHGFAWPYYPGSAATMRSR